MAKKDIVEFMEETKLYISMTAFMARDEWLDMVACIREAYQEARRQGMDDESIQLQELYGEAFEMRVVDDMPIVVAV